MGSQTAILNIYVNEYRVLPNSIDKFRGATEREEEKLPKNMGLQTVNFKYI